MRAEKIEREAADWLAAKDAGPLTPEQDVALQAWLGQSDRHAAAFIRLANCWDQAERFRGLRTPHHPVNLDLLRIPGHSRRSRWMLASAVAASLLVVAAVWVTMLPPWGAKLYRTPVGGVARIPLADGSVVTLNTASEVQVRFTAERREVRLITGEAEFSVAHDPNRAFDVRVGSETVRAVGTVFAVRWLGGDDVRVVVTAGRVAILPTVVLAQIPVNALPVTTQTIYAGEQADMGPHDRVRVRKTDAHGARAEDWARGRLWFDRATLREAVAEFNRYNSRQLVIDDEALAELRIGGAFDAHDLESFAAALRSFGVVIDESDPATVRLSKAP